MYSLFYVQSKKIDKRCPKDTKDIGHFMFFCQLQQFITLFIFGDFEWFKFKNVIQEVYFIPHFLVKSKFQVEGHVWKQEIIGHF